VLVLDEAHTAAHASGSSKLFQVLIGLFLHTFILGTSREGGIRSAHESLFSPFLHASPVFISFDLLNLSYVYLILH